MTVFSLEFLYGTNMGIAFVVVFEQKPLEGDALGTSVWKGAASEGTMLQEVTWQHEQAPVSCQSGGGSCWHVEG